MVDSILADVDGLRFALALFAVKTLKALYRMSARAESMSGDGSTASTTAIRARVKAFATLQTKVRPNAAGGYAALAWVAGEERDWVAQCAHYRRVMAIADAAEDNVWSLFARYDLSAGIGFGGEARSVEGKIYGLKERDYYGTQTNFEQMEGKMSDLIDPAVIRRFAEESGPLEKRLNRWSML